jgi:hypothetical protein
MGKPPRLGKEESMVGVDLHGGARRCMAFWQLG